ncbi:MAG: radical SAM protein [Acidobacteriota bacterium]
MTRPRVVLYNPRAVFHTMPLATLAVASALDRRAFDVVIVDGRLERDPVAAVLEATRGALCLGVSVLTGAPIRDALAVTRAVKDARPGCSVVWGGWHPSLFAAQCLAEPAIDVVVTGQGEETFREVVERLAAGDVVDGCAGTVTGRGGAIRHAPARPLRGLDDLPAHDYGLLRVEEYFVRKRARQIDYVSSQGCRFRCAFCADPAVFDRAWTGLAPERVAEELAFLERAYAATDVAFQDETFFTQPARVEALCDGLRRRGTRFTWTATLRADQACRLGDERFAAAVAAGLRRVMVGVEAGSQEMLERLQKDVTLEQVRRTVDLCLRHGVGAIFNFIVGFPGESDASVNATLALAKTIGARSPAFETPIFCYRPYPGNPLADDASRAGYEFPSSLEAWADFDYVGARGPWVSAARWREVERFRFYARHAVRPGRWRAPLRAAARWRCDRDWYGLPVEKFLVELVRPSQPVS